MPDELTAEQANTIAFWRGYRMRVAGAPRPESGHKRSGWDQADADLGARERADERLSELVNELAAQTEGLEGLEERVKALEERPDHGGY